MKLVAWPTEILRGDYGDDREGDRYYCDISYTLIRLADGINQKSQGSVRLFLYIRKCMRIRGGSRICVDSLIALTWIIYELKIAR
jgi:hypothetical protein